MTIENKMTPMLSKKMHNEQRNMYTNAQQMEEVYCSEYM